MTYLIAGLGNPGEEYSKTRHNVGFMCLDHFTKKFNTSFFTDKNCHLSTLLIKGRKINLIKPTTYVNLSGIAVKYYLNKLKISPENLLVVLDDLSLPFGTLKIKEKGSDAGHNGLKSIDESLGNNNYARLRFGIGADFQRRRQVDYVLGNFSSTEQSQLNTLFETTSEIILSFVFRGISSTMNQFNVKK